MHYKIAKISDIEATLKLGLDVIQEFEFNGNRYWELGCEASKPVV
jgi:hypothetical protein